MSFLNKKAAEIKPGDRIWFPNAFDYLRVESVNFNALTSEIHFLSVNRAHRRSLNVHALVSVEEEPTEPKALADLTFEELLARHVSSTNELKAIKVELHKRIDLL